MKPKASRQDLNAPEWVLNEWKTGDRNSLADMFVNENFDKVPLFISYNFRFPIAPHQISWFGKPWFEFTSSEISFESFDSLPILMDLMVCCLLAFCKARFVNKLQVIVRKRQAVELTVDEGWYSEQEMKDDLGWAQTCPQTTSHVPFR